MTMHPQRPRLHIVPLELREANAVVAAWHRHHQPTIGHRFSVGVVDDQGVIHGAAIAGRPVARLAGSPREVLEVLRLVTDGTYNACSMLYSAIARAGRAMGYKRVQTYILAEEAGTSLKASGWTSEGPAGGDDWNREGRVRRTDQPQGTKERWAVVLDSTTRPQLTFPTPATHHDQLELEDWTQ